MIPLYQHMRMTVFFIFSTFVFHLKYLEIYHAFSYLVINISSVCLGVQQCLSRCPHSVVVPLVIQTASYCGMFRCSGSWGEAYGNSHSYIFLKGAVLTLFKTIVSSTKSVSVTGVSWQQGCHKILYRHIIIFFSSQRGSVYVNMTVVCFESLLLWN